MARYFYIRWRVCFLRQKSRFEEFFCCFTTYRKLINEQIVKRFMDVKMQFMTEAAAVATGRRGMLDSR